MKRLDNRVVVVMGGGSVAPGWGIGKASSVAFARKGAKVAVVDVNRDAAEETVRIIREEGGEASAYQVDATAEAAVRDLMKEVRARYGRLDVLHNNVGLGKRKDPASLTVEEWRQSLDGNVLALHLASQAAIPYMREHGKGVILITSTVVSLRHVGQSHIPYGVTKAAANHFARLMAVDYAADGIRVNTIIAGLMDTPRVHLNIVEAYGGDDKRMVAERSGQVPLGFMGDGWDVANAAVFLASDDARYITGAELVVDGGLTATIRGG